MGVRFFGGEAGGVGLWIEGFGGGWGFLGEFGGFWGTWLRRASRSISSVCSERRRAPTVPRAVSRSFVLCVTSRVVSVIWEGKEGSGGARGHPWGLGGSGLGPTHHGHPKSWRGCGG